MLAILKTSSKIFYLIHLRFTTTIIETKIKKLIKSFIHMHGDQTHGINDLRSFYINAKNNPVFMLINILLNIYNLHFLTYLKLFKRISCNTQTK